MSKDREMRLELVKHLCKLSNLLSDNSNQETTEPDSAGLSPSDLLLSLEKSLLLCKKLAYSEDVTLTSQWEPELSRDRQVSQSMVRI